MYIYIYILYIYIVANQRAKEEEQRRMEEEKRLASLNLPSERVINDLVFEWLFPQVEEKVHQQQGTIRHYLLLYLYISIISISLYLYLSFYLSCNILISSLL